MKKLAMLLDDITIINFGLLFKLGMRYTLHFFLAIGMFFYLYFNYYYTQPIIFSTSVPMKVSMKQQAGMEMAITGKPDVAASVSIGELNATFGSFAFNKTFADFVAKDKEFLTMNFGSIATGKAFRGSEISRNCSDKNDCIVNTVAGLVGGLFTIDQGLTEDRFSLTVNSLERDTTLKLSNALALAVDKNRIESRRYSLSKEIDSVDSLIAETRNYLRKQNGLQKIEEEEKNAQTISDLKERMRIIQSSLSNEIANYSAIDAKYKENKKILAEADTSEGLNKIRHKDTEKKILDIRHNILTITNIREDKRSESDKLILKQLQSDLKDLEAMNAGGESARSLALKDNFSDDQKSKENELKFDVIVSKSKIANLQADYESIKLHLNSFQKDKTSREAILSKLKAEIEFLKSLEAKEISLKVTNSTMTSDLQFEDFSKNVGSFRRSSPIKIGMFSFCLTLVIYLFTLIGRYMIDTRIYSEEDVSLYLTNLEFYGEVPNFD